MDTKFSFNFHAQNLKDRNKALQWVKDHRPETVVVLNDRKFASSCADLGVKYPILRITNNDDEIQLKLRSFQEWWDSVKAVYQEDKRLLVHFANEPHTDLLRLSQFCSEGMKTLHSESYCGVFANFSVGTPNKSDLSLYLTSMLDSFKTYPEHFLGIHEYFMGDPAWCIPDFIGRLKQFNVPIILTEFGFDFIPQIASAHVLPNLRGWKSHAKYYNGNEAKLVSMVKAALSQYPSNVHGVNFFCYGDSGGWSDYNAEEWDMLLQGEFSMTQIMTPVPMVSLNIQAKSGTVNRREQPNTNAPIHGTLTSIVTVSKIAVTNDGWTQYIFQDGTYWVNDAVVTTVQSSTVTLDLINATPEDAQAFKDALNTITALSAKYKISVGV